MAFVPTIPYETMSAGSVSGILQKGGTILRTFRYPQFATEAGAVPVGRALKKLKLDGMVIIGFRRRQLPRRHFLKKMRLGDCRVPEGTRWTFRVSSSAGTGGETIALSAWSHTPAVTYCLPENYGQ